MRTSLFARMLSFSILAMAVCFSIQPAQSQVSPVSTESLSRQADVIAVAHVSSLLPEWDESRTRITTRVILSVSEYVKGSNSGTTLTLLVPGGEIDGVGEMYSDMPVFRKDEDIMVFAVKDKGEQYRVAGGVQGKYSISTESVTGSRLISGGTPLAQFVAQVRKSIVAPPAESQKSSTK